MRLNAALCNLLAASYGLTAAHEIHAGQCDLFSGEYDKKVGKVIIPGEFKLPFAQTLITYQALPFVQEEGDGRVSCSKRAILINDIGSHLVFSNFNYSDDRKSWEMFPLSAHMQHGSAVGHFVSVYGDAIPAELLFADGEVQQDLMEEITVAATVLDIINCKNVSLSPISPPERLNRSRIKKGKLPLYRYHVLTLDLDKGRKLAGDVPKRSLGTAPVHLCRGHFKEYTADQPLFGRVTGRFWWQPHARGKAQNGIIMKDYRIKKKGK